MTDILNETDLNKLDTEDTKTLMLELSIAGFSVKEIVQKLHTSRQRLYKLLRDDKEFALQFKYARHVIEVAINEFINISTDEEKIDLLDELCRYLPWSIVLDCQDVVNNCISKIHQSLTTPSNYDLMGAITVGREAYFTKLENHQDE